MLNAHTFFPRERLVFGHRRQMLPPSPLPPPPFSPLSRPPSSPENTKSERQKIRRMTSSEHCAIIVPFFSTGALSYIVLITANSITANSSTATFTPHPSLLAAAATAAACFFFYIFLCLDLFHSCKYTRRKIKD